MFTVEYALTRGEVWRWYWQAWAKPAGLWRFQVLVGLIVAIAVTLPYIGTATVASQFLSTALVAIFTVMFISCCWPQIKYKSQQRKLSIDQVGITTEIGKLREEIPWEKIKNVAQQADTLIITGKNGNAFIVPNRAFTSSVQRDEFLQAAQAWHSQAATN